MSTEIYICKDGQDLREGKLDYSDDIVDRDGAEADAKRRCQRDTSIRKVAYYAVAPDGGFRLIHAYTNPDCRPAARPRPAAAATPRKKAAVRPAPPPGLLTRLRRAIGL